MFGPSPLSGRSASLGALHLRPSDLLTKHPNHMSMIAVHKPSPLRLSRKGGLHSVKTCVLVSSVWLRGRVVSAADFRYTSLFTLCPAGREGMRSLAPFACHLDKLSRVSNIAVFVDLNEELPSHEPW